MKNKSQMRDVSQVLTGVRAGMGRGEPLPTATARITGIPEAINDGYVPIRRTITGNKNGAINEVMMPQITNASELNAPS